MIPSCFNEQVDYTAEIQKYVHCALNIYEQMDLQKQKKSTKLLDGHIKIKSTRIVIHPFSNKNLTIKGSFMFLHTKKTIIHWCLKNLLKKIDSSQNMCFKLLIDLIKLYDMQQSIQNLTISVLLCTSIGLKGSEIPRAGLRN